MSAASDWVALVDEVEAQEPPRFQGQTITQARVAPNGAMRLQMVGGAYEVSASEALALGQWISATFNGTATEALEASTIFQMTMTGTLT